MKITFDLKPHMNEDGTVSETIAKSIEQLTGKSFSEVYQQSESESKPNYPEGNPASWKRDVKLSFIAEHGRSEYERLIDEHK